MQLNELRTDDDAVSPVIGVILMVAITVILAAVIATFVLGLGSQLSNTTPTTTFSFDYDEGSYISDGDGDEGDGTLSITHAGGDSIQANELFIRGASTSDNGGWADSGTGNADFGAQSRLTAGQGISIEVGSGDVIRIVYEAQQGGQSAVLERWPGPDA